MYYIYLHQSLTTYNYNTMIIKVLPSQNTLRLSRIEIFYIKY